MIDVYSHIVSFLPHHVARPIREIYISMIISRLATGMIMVFEPIFLYSLGLSIPLILLFFLHGQLWYFFSAPLAGKLILRWGYRVIIPLSTLFLIIYLGALVGMEWSLWLGILAGIAQGLRKSFYFVAMHYNFAAYGDSDEEGRQVGLRQAIEVLVAALGPFLGGLILTISSFNMLFLFTAVLLLVSNVPFIQSVQHIQSEAQITFKKVFQLWKNRDEKPYLWSSLGYGEIVVSMTLWPLYLSIFIFDSLLSLGSIIALSTFVTVASLLFVGRFSDGSNKRPILRASSIIYSFLWFLRPLVSGITGIFLLDAVTKFTRQIVMIPQTALIYDHARSGHHPMLISTAFIMNIVLGKMIVLILAMLAFLLLSLHWAWIIVFALAGLFSLLYSLE